MFCESCQSTNQSKFPSKVNIHFPERNNGTVRMGISGACDLSGLWLLESRVEGAELCLLAEEHGKRDIAW